MIHRRADLDDRTLVFHDRAGAGRALAELVRTLDVAVAFVDPIVLAIPAGGVPVALEIARAFGWPLDVAVVSKITLPWNTEAGYGAVAFDGSIRLNDRVVAECALNAATIADGIAKTRIKVERRLQRLRHTTTPPPARDKTAIVVDDGLASGLTMELAADAVRALGARAVIVAVPTGHRAAVERVEARADAVVCANVRAGVPFAVADAYERWADVPELVAEDLLRRHEAESKQIA